MATYTNQVSPQAEISDADVIAELVQRNVLLQSISWERNLIDNCLAMAQVQNDTLSWERALIDNSLTIIQDHS